MSTNPSISSDTKVHTEFDFWHEIANLSYLLSDTPHRITNVACVSGMVDITIDGLGSFNGLAWHVFDDIMEAIKHVEHERDTESGEHGY